ncbi:MAG: hypothetical protein MZU84_06825 [Sphingobacterium sp.]|nr:hypothetical protein [Sphingobacterium sp.]
MDMDSLRTPGKRQAGAVDKLLEYFEASRTGNEKIANTDAYAIELETDPRADASRILQPLADSLNLWIDQNRNVPLAAAYTGGSMGEVRIAALELEINQGVDEGLFTFEIPAGVEVVGFADMKPRSLTLDEAAASAEFEFLTLTLFPLAQHWWMY